MAENRQFKRYISGLSESDREKVASFFESMESRSGILPRRERQKLVQDFENALLWYHENNVDPDRALHYALPENLGGFFSRPSVLWFPLDNAAKVYPIALRYNFMAVFRLSAVLRDNVVPQLLQLALNFTVKRFPHFATTLKKGFFWHYLNADKRRYTVREENTVPCTPIKTLSGGVSTFRVLYWKNRISVEFFHVLTDGTGGMVFLKSLVSQYLRLRYLLEDDSEYGFVNGFPCSEESENAFERFKKKVPASGFMDRIAVQMNGRPSASGAPSRIVHIKMDTGSLRDVSHGYDATVTAYLLALMFIASKAATDVQKGELAVQVPVNMRKYYSSKTLMNFSMYIIVRMNIEDIPPTMEGRAAISMVDCIKNQLREKGTQENLDRMVASASRFVRLLRYVPLPLKQPVARQVYGFLGDKLFSNTLSNLGTVEMSPVYSKYIESMDFVLGTGITNRAACSIVTFGGKSVFSITKYTEDPAFEEKMVQLLQTDKVHFTVEGSMIWK